MSIVNSNEGLPYYLRNEEGVTFPCVLKGHYVYYWGNDSILRVTGMNDALHIETSIISSTHVLSSEIQDLLPLRPKRRKVNIRTGGSYRYGYLYS